MLLLSVVGGCDASSRSGEEGAPSAEDSWVANRNAATCHITAADGLAASLQESPACQKKSLKAFEKKSKN
jgi:hypothetical protein